MEGKPLMAYRNIAGEVYHLPDEKIHRWSIGLCGYAINQGSIVRQFEDIKNPNICRHCAIEFKRRGY